MEKPHADPVTPDHCWQTAKFPSELEVEMHASKIFNRDGASGVISKF